MSNVYLIDGNVVVPGTTAVLIDSGLVESGPNNLSLAIDTAGAITIAGRSVTFSLGAAPTVNWIADWVPMSLAARFHEVRIRWAEPAFNALVLAEAAGAAVWARYPPGKVIHKPEVWVWLMIKTIG